MNDTPTRLDRVGDSALRIVWADGHESVYTWRLLREQCPCAVCKPSEVLASPAEVPLPIPQGIRATAVNPVGRYAIHVTWSDGHTTGIYAYEYLRRLCPCEACQPKQFEEG